MNTEKHLTGKEKRNRIAELYEDTILWDDMFDDALIGVTDGMKAVYDIYKMQCILYEQFKEDESELTFEDAVEYLDYNVLCAYVGEFTPIHIWVFNNDSEG